MAIKCSENKHKKWDIIYLRRYLWFKLIPMWIFIIRRIFYDGAIAAGEIITAF